MGLFTKFDLESDFTLFFLGFALVLMIIAVALARATGRNGRQGGGRGFAVKHDDQIIDRNREIID